jgi:hypothetical protein
MYATGHFRSILDFYAHPMQFCDNNANLSAVNVCRKSHITLRLV